MSCEPKGKKIAYSMLAPCERLTVIEDALFAAASGETKTTVRHGDFWIEKVPASVAFLERERARLQRICDAERGVSRRAITMGRSANWPRCGGR